jgi:arylsulfatase A-like enzyme
MGDDGNAQHGFTFWHTVPGGGGTFRNPEFVTNGQRRKLEGFKTDLVTDGALEFLDSAKGKPFYLLVPFYAPHTPYDFQPEQHRARYKDASFACFPDDPRHPNQNPGLNAHHHNRESKLSYSALVSGVDHNVGRILRRLDELGVREDTLVIFTADQGYNCGHHGVWGKGNGTMPFNMYEESIRVPMIWNHPKRIRGGQVLTPLISSYDYMPTLLDYLGLPRHQDAKLPGRSYTGFLQGRRPSPVSQLYFEYCYTRAIRTGKLKYVERTREFPSELYDLEADPGEKENVISDRAYAKPLATLRSDLERFFEKAGAPPLEEWRSTTKQRLFTYKRP